MINWYLDKASKVPLYLQLKEQIRYHISTGGLRNKEQLPAVNRLAEELSINFETVRKAYKELEKEGLIFMQRAKGTIVTIDNRSTQLAARPLLGAEASPDQLIHDAVDLLVRNGESPEGIMDIVRRSIENAVSEHRERFIIFTECNSLQVKEISAQLRDVLKEQVRPVLLSDLEGTLARLGPEEKHLQAIVTTGFHLNDVRAALGPRQVSVHILITNMSPESRRKIDEIGPDSRFGFICRDEESIPLYNDLLKAEFGKKIKLTSAFLGDKARIEAVLHSVDVLLVTPPVYAEIKKMAPAALPIFNVFDRVDPMSIRVLQERLRNQA